MIARSSLLLWVLCSASACRTAATDAEAAAAEGDYTTAAELFGRAAVDSGCPGRGEYLLRRADVQELSGQSAQAAESIHKAVEHCPDVAEAWWRRAQRRKEAGDKVGAMEDARHVQDAIPEAKALYEELALEFEMARSLRSAAQKLVKDLQGSLAPEALPEDLSETVPAELARQVPVPISLKYEVRTTHRKPSSWELGWFEHQSFRGDASEPTFSYVRWLEMPPLERELPMTVRLLMANQRMQMRFDIDNHGQILEALWATEGPDRGMRPEMLRPQVQGELRRRRVFEPGESGRRAPGDRWRGEDVRVLDGKPREITYSAMAQGWVRMAGVRTLRIEANFVGSGYQSKESLWIHPETAVVVRSIRSEQYDVVSDAGTVPWSTETRSQLVSVSGGE